MRRKEKVRLNASGPEDLRPGGTGDEGNPPKADKRSRWAFSDRLDLRNRVMRTRWKISTLRL